MKTARLLLTLAFVAGWPLVGSASSDVAARVKAAFLYNFAKFTEWPPEALTPGQRLTLCVIGDAAVADALEQTIKGRAIEGHALTVQVLQTTDAAASCHLIYIDGVDLKRSVLLLAALKAAPVLSVSDGNKFTDIGGIAQLILENDRMRFAINVTAAERARLRLSSKLLGLATIVREKPNGQP